MTATIWKQMFAFSFVLLSLLAVSVPFQSPGSAARVITVVSAVLILVALFGTGVVIALDWDPF
jgi:protein-S-isoprenylcysteine O-methyltransferase Ste14